MQVVSRHSFEISSIRPWLEQVLFQLGDVFEIRIVLNRDTAVFTSVLALTGALIGGLAGGRMGAAIGTGIGGVAGFGISTVISLREAWEKFKEQLQELLYIIFNYLRHLHPQDYVKAFKILMQCSSNRRQLVITIIEFIADKLSTEVLSNISPHCLE